MNQTVSARRWVYLVVGVLAMLFAGVIYAWSILKAPFAAELGWDASQLALNFTITMTFFCLGGFVGAKLSHRFGVMISTIAAGVLAALGFVLASTLDGSSIFMLYVSYGVLAGLGIGIAYNVVISTVNAWFPDKKGLCSGCLMMGFGASTLVLGNLADAAMKNMDWRNVFVILGAALGVVLVIAGLILRRPGADVTLPAPKVKKNVKSENFEIRDYSTGEMLARPSFWMAFVGIGLLAAVGNSVISFAKDLALSVGAAASLATTLVGVLFDAMGRRFTMMASNILTIAAAGVTLIAVMMSSLPLCIVGLCLVGLSYGSCPTVSSAFVSAFYGGKYFPTNFSIMNFNLIGSSLMATACGSLLTATNGYMAPFILLLGLACGALVLNFIIRKP